MARDPLLDTFASRIRWARESHDWSMHTLAQHSGLTPTTIMQAERGRNITLLNAVAVTDALGLPRWEVLNPGACSKCQGTPGPWTKCLGCGREGPAGNENKQNKQQGEGGNQ